MRHRAYLGKALFDPTYFHPISRGNMKDSEEEEWILSC